MLMQFNLLCVRWKLSAASARSSPGCAEFPSQTAPLTLLFSSAAAQIKHPQGGIEKRGKLGLYPISTGTVRLPMRGFTLVCFWVSAELDNNVLETPLSYRTKLFQQEWLIFLSGISICFLKHRIQNYPSNTWKKKQLHRYLMSVSLGAGRIFTAGWLYTPFQT